MNVYLPKKKQVYNVTSYIRWYETTRGEALIHNNGIMEVTSEMLHDDESAGCKWKGRIVPEEYIDKNGDIQSRPVLKIFWESIQ